MKLKIATLFLACCAASNAFADWSYSKDVDPMSGNVVTSGRIKSTNSLDLEFPYKGQNYGALTIIQRQKQGPSVLLSIQKGQIICRSYENCSVNVRFDESPAMTFSGSPSVDHDPKYLFIGNEQKFIARATKAKKILVQVTIYQSGANILEFSSSAPLNMPDPGSKKKM